MDNQDQARLTTDCIIFGLDESHKLKVLLIQRGTQPYKDMWALPGGPVHKAEALRQAALRVLEEETGVHDIFMEQLFTFGKLGRDPRGRFVTVAYFALVNLLEHPAEAKADTRNVEWFEITNLPKLAFDHEDILELAIKQLRSRMRYQPVGFELLPEHFTMPQLQQLYETISGQELNKRNFRTRIKNMDILEKVGQQENVAHRPASLYRFDKGKYEVYLQEQQKDVLRRVVDFES
ncbi:MAG: 8-oxo-dGTP diphosphatase [Paraglaciecola sp.]|jgi:8-oxo-dGTP diphosphatase